MSTEPPIILDTYFLSSFAWVDRLDILEGLYSKRMLILEEGSLTERKAFIRSFVNEVRVTGNEVLLNYTIPM